MQLHGALRKHHVVLRGVAAASMSFRLAIGKILPSAQFQQSGARLVSRPNGGYRLHKRWISTARAGAQAAPFLVEGGSGVLLYVATLVTENGSRRRNRSGYLSHLL